MAASRVRIPPSPSQGVAAATTLVTCALDEVERDPDRFDPVQVVAARGELLPDAAEGVDGFLAVVGDRTGAVERVPPDLRRPDPRDCPLQLSRVRGCDREE